MRIKKCTKCHKKKKEIEFHKWDAAYDGRYPSCKDCVRDRMGFKKRIPREVAYRGIIRRRCSKCKKYRPKTFFYKAKCYRNGVAPNCKECCISNVKSELFKTQQKSKRSRIRMEVLIHYGGTPPKCACCGENTFEFLCIDHINGNGIKHRKKLGNHYMSKIRNDYPNGLQVLCHNCNMAKGFYGECPHKNNA